MIESIRTFGSRQRALDAVNDISPEFGGLHLAAPHVHSRLWS